MSTEAKIQSEQSEIGAPLVSAVFPTGVSAAADRQSSSGRPHAIPCHLLSADSAPTQMQPQQHGSASLKIADRSHRDVCCLLSRGSQISAERHRGYHLAG